MITIEKKDFKEFLETISLLELEEIKKSLLFNIAIEKCWETHCILKTRLELTKITIKEKTTKIRKKIMGEN